MIDLFKVYMPENLNDRQLKDILFSGKLTSGVFVNQFEKALQNYIGNPYIMVTANNNLATLIALSALDIKPGDEIIASPMACLASNMPISNYGAKAIWADIDPTTGTLDPKDVKTKINSNTKAILHYHWGGYPGYIDEINIIGKEYGIPVIDDAIESFGSEYKGKIMGNLGTDITVFSFQTVRLPNSIDGGAIAFTNKEMFEKAKRLRDYGIDRASFRDELGEISPKSDINISGYNGVLNEMNAYIGLQVLIDTPELINKQRNNALLWDSICDDLNIIRMNNRSEIKPNYWIYSMLSDKQMNDITMFRNDGYYASKVHLRNDHYSVFGKFNNKLLGVNSFAKMQLAVPSGWWKK